MIKSHSEALRDHIDRFCRDEPDNLFKEDLTKISVAKFDNIPDSGLTTFISIGLSGHLLKQDSGRSIRQELLLTVDNLYADFAIEEVIFSVAKLILKDHKAVSRGQVIGPKGLLFPEEDSNLTCLLCSYPAFFPDDFSFFENSETTVFVELIPMLTREAELSNQIGWEKFFGLIDDGEVDILNYHR
ncbi:suppressor of fused domain protein [Zooshikella ganghwensis]|uniref:Suppressor of fused domain protein n=1 Tax=Zooshikella ganghwensis TaxID=202772 RepID=A0A4P9VJ21_9GAMM|nr:suppressor of fused domain protein [Zooshikella ganghwensis]RDH42207.1 suppressor of fused domain protein [Zooshikella ganghwensis]